MDLLDHHRPWELLLSFARQPSWISFIYQIAQVSVAVIILTYTVVDRKSRNDTYTKPGIANAPKLTCYFYLFQFRGWMRWRRYQWSSKPCVWWSGPEFSLRPLQWYLRYRKIQTWLRLLLQTDPSFARICISFQRVQPWGQPKEISTIHTMSRHSLVWPMLQFFRGQRPCNSTRWNAVIRIH